MLHLYTKADLPSARADLGPELPTFASVVLSVSLLIVHMVPSLVYGVCSVLDSNEV